jgi:hypothetical protein
MKKGFKENNSKYFAKNRKSEMERWKKILTD